MAEDGRYDVVASGSLLGIKYKKGRKRRQPKSIPVGFERQVIMHSPSFREFLWAKGYDNGFISHLEGYFQRRESVPEVINAKIHELLREYIVEGGMPEVVRSLQ